MSEPTEPAAGQAGIPAAVLSRWQALAEKRLAHFIELRESGRWSHYFASRAALDGEIRECVRLVGEWRQHAGGRALAPSAEFALARVA